MALDFPGHADAMRRTLDVAERCNVELELGRILLPVYPTPEGREAFDYLVELCEKGLQKRYGKATTELNERLQYELKTIKEMGFTDYFLRRFAGRLYNVELFGVERIPSSGPAILVANHESLFFVGAVARMVER
jgi:hypothetical protein